MNKLFVCKWLISESWKLFRELFLIYNLKPSYDKILW